MVELSAYLDLARRWWSTLLIALCVGALGGFLVAATVPGGHRAEARLLVGPVNGGIDTLRASSQLTRTYADLATSDTVLVPALATAGLAAAPDEIVDSLEVTGNELTRILTVGVELPNADDAARLANAIAESLSVATSAQTERPEGLLTVVQAAAPGALPETSRAPLLILLAAGGGLFAALAMVLLIEGLDTRVRDRERLDGLTGGALLGLVRVVGDRPRPAHDVDLRPDASDVDYAAILGELVSRSRGPVRSVAVVGVGRLPVSAAVSRGLARAAADAFGAVKLVDASGTEASGSWTGGGYGSGANGNDDRGDLGPMVRVVSLRRETYGDTASLAHTRDELLSDSRLLVVDAGVVAGSVIAAMWTHVVDAVLVCVFLGVDDRRDVTAAWDRLGASADRSWAIGARYRRVRGVPAPDWATEGRMSDAPGTRTATGERVARIADRGSTRGRPRERVDELRR